MSRLQVGPQPGEFLALRSVVAFRFPARGLGLHQALLQLALLLQTGGGQFLNLSFEAQHPVFQLTALFPRLHQLLLHFLLRGDRRLAHRLLFLEGQFAQQPVIEVLMQLSEQLQRHGPVAGRPSPLGHPLPFLERLPLGRLGEARGEPRQHGLQRPALVVHRSGIGVVARGLGQTPVKLDELCADRLGLAPLEQSSQLVAVIAQLGHRAGDGGGALNPGRLGQHVRQVLTQRCHPGQFTPLLEGLLQKPHPRLGIRLMELTPQEPQVVPFETVEIRLLPQQRRHGGMLAVGQGRAAGHEARDLRSQIGSPVLCPPRCHQLQQKSHTSHHNQRADHAFQSGTTGRLFGRRPAIQIVGQILGTGVQPGIGLLLGQMRIAVSQTPHDDLDEGGRDLVCLQNGVLPAGPLALWLGAGELARQRMKHHGRALPQIGRLTGPDLAGQQAGGRKPAGARLSRDRMHRTIPPGQPPSLADVDQPDAVPLADQYVVARDVAVDQIRVVHPLDGPRQGGTQPHPVRQGKVPGLGDVVADAPSGNRFQQQKRLAGFGSCRLGARLIDPAVVVGQQIAQGMVARKDLAFPLEQLERDAVGGVVADLHHERPPGRAFLATDDHRRGPLGDLPLRFEPAPPQLLHRARPQQAPRRIIEPQFGMQVGRVAAGEGNHRNTRRAEGRRCGPRSGWGGESQHRCRRSHSRAA